MAISRLGGRWRRGVSSRAIIAAMVPAIIILIVLGLLAVKAAVSHEAPETVFQPLKPEVVDHTEMFAEAGIEEYEGSKSCLACHEDEVKEFHESYHYQMASTAADLAGREETLVGGAFVYNDFCGAIFWEGKVLNWIGYVTLKNVPEGYEDLLGEFTGLTGCSMCHGVGMGLPPSPEASSEQLENIDCLACHVDPKVYVSGPKSIAEGKRTVEKDEDGRWRYKVLVDADELARNIIDVPTTANCLACHAFSGGGPHLKRPNIGPDLLDGVTEDGEVFDVHIAAGMSCVDCHPGSGHKFATDATDTWSREGERPGETTKTCEQCHTGEPHEGVIGSAINTFHTRVACQTCHIPEIAGGDYPTEIYRDWSAATFLPEKKRWKFSIPDPETKDTSKWYLVDVLEPVYAWYNGERTVYLPGDKAEPIAGDPLEIEPVDGVSKGVVYYVKPAGDRDDPEAKIYPFKLHRAVVPYSTVNSTLVPMKVGIAFATGDVKAATMKGAEATGIEWDGESYVTLIRYMQVDHGVKPAEDALFCLDCHGPVVKRMDWQELGYGRFPQVAFTLGVASTLVVVVGITILLYRRIQGN